MNAPTIFEAIDADLIEPQRLASSVLDHLTNEQRRPPAQRRGITSREALLALEFEAHFAAVAAENLAQGLVLTDVDRARLWVAYGRIRAIAAEVAR